MPTQTNAPPRLVLPAWLPALLLLGLALLWFAVRAVHGIHFAGFVDESGHLVGARAIAAGDRLYRDFIDAHGPLCFMVAQAFGTVFGWTEPLDARWATAGFALVASFAIGTSPALATATARLWAAALFLGLVAAPWIVQSLYLVDYHLYGGALTAIVLAWLVIPAWLHLRIARWQAAASGVCLALLCAAAYALAPSALLLAAGAIIALPDRAAARLVVRALAAGFFGGAAITLAWLLIFGDVVGYLVFHVIQMQVNYARYIPFGWRAMGASLIPSASPDHLIQSQATLTGLAGLVIVLLRGMGRGLRSVQRAVSALCWALGILMLNFRGSALFQDGSFLVAGAALLALALPALLTVGRPATVWLSWGGTVGIGLLLVGAELTDRQAISSPFGFTRAQIAAQPRTSMAVNGLAMQQRIRQVLRPG